MPSLMPFLMIKAIKKPKLDEKESRKEAALERKNPAMEAGETKKTGSYKGKSNALGHGGRAAQLRDEGVPGRVIGAIARSKGAAPGQKNYHPTKKGK